MPVNLVDNNAIQKASDDSVSTPILLEALDAEIACLSQCYEAFNLSPELKNSEEQEVAARGIAVIKVTRATFELPEEFGDNAVSIKIRKQIIQLRSFVCVRFKTLLHENKAMLLQIQQNNMVAYNALNKVDEDLVFEPLFNQQALNDFSRAYPQTTEKLNLIKVKNSLSRFFRATRPSNWPDVDTFLEKTLKQFSGNLKKHIWDLLQFSTRLTGLMASPERFAQFTKAREAIVREMPKCNLGVESSLSVAEDDGTVSVPSDTEGALPEDATWRDFFGNKTRDMIVRTLLEQKGTTLARATKSLSDKLSAEVNSKYVLNETPSSQARHQAYLATKNRKGGRENHKRSGRVIANMADRECVIALSQQLCEVSQLASYYKRSSEWQISLLKKLSNNIQVEETCLKLYKMTQEMLVCQEAMPEFDASLCKTLEQLSANTPVDVLTHHHKAECQGHVTRIPLFEHRNAIAFSVTLLGHKDSAFFKAYNTRRQAKMYLALLHKMDHHPEQLLGEQAGLRSQAVDYLHAHREKTPALRQHFENRFALMPYQAPRSDSNLPKSNANCSI